MCQQRFAVSWKKQKNKNNSSAPSLPCPSLDTPIEVNFYKKFDYDNIIDLWTNWNQDYFNYDGPRLLVRLEDLVYEPKTTLQQICDCAGGSFQYDPNILEDRHGGVAQVRKQSQSTTKKDHFLAKAWNRHAGVSIETILASSTKNQELFVRQISTKAKMQNLLDELHYQIS
jgi:hypothetical protein